MGMEYTAIYAELDALRAKIDALIPAQQAIAAQTEQNAELAQEAAAAAVVAASAAQESEQESAAAVVQAIESAGIALEAAAVVELETEQEEEESQDEQADIESDTGGDTPEESTREEESGGAGSVGEPERIVIEQRGEPSVDTNKRYGWRRGRRAAS